MRSIRSSVAFMIILFSPCLSLAERLPDPNIQLSFVTKRDIYQQTPIQREKSKENMDIKLVNWIKSNVSFVTQLPLSFYIPRDKRESTYARMGDIDSVAGIIERMIVEEGLDIYDGAVGQIVLTMMGGKENLERAFYPLEIYWRGYLGEFQRIRAGYPLQPFIYDPQNPLAVSSDLSLRGKRGFIFRIINANGRYNTRDPLDNKTIFEKFPTWPTVHWEDWKPVAGENAWVVLAALHLYHKKYFDPSTQTYKTIESSIELQLAEELARAALLLQSEIGGIRMAPLGTYRETQEPPIPYHADNSWWYYQISTENNISWYAALRMLYAITQKEIYHQAMMNIEKFFKSAWNKEENYFYQGMNFSEGIWQPNTKDFALDAQAWSIAALGPPKIDSWFGEGSAYRLWQKAKTLSGFCDENGRLLGVGYTQEHDRISVEWTAGAILAIHEMVAYYKDSHPEWSNKLRQDGQTMRAGIEFLRQEFSPYQAAYAYSSKRGWIPFGWNSHTPEVVSLASTGWVVMVDYHYNPFYLSPP